MVKNLIGSVKSFLAAKHAIAVRERQLIEDLNRVLPEIGYQVVPAATEPSVERVTSPSPVPEMGRNRSREESSRKPLGCPHCSRRFARPLHLGRHMSATHSSRSRKKAA